MKLSRSLLDAALFASLGVTSPIGAVAVEQILRATDAVKADATWAARRALNYEQLTPHENAYCNPGECLLREGTYEDPWGDTYDWWGYVPDPQGPYACPEEGCPLFIGISGTGQDFFHPADAQWWMFEMMKRGFAGVTVGYANANTDMGLCYGQSFINLPAIPDSPYGAVQKAQHIFDPDTEGSVIRQVCDDPEAFANCNLGIAAAGVSQGSFIVAQGSNFERRISALLLWATGDDMQRIRDFVGGGGCAQLGTCYLDWPCPCMDNIQLPAVRRRMINGAADLFFGRDAAGTLEQYKRITGGYYDCGNSFDCLTRAPETVADKYTGGSIANEGGYHIVDGGGHTNGWLRCLCDGQDCEQEEESTCVDPAPYFDNTSATKIEQGPASFDWLSRTARITYTPPTAVQEEVTLDIDLDHWRLFNAHTKEGFYLEWADANGVFGQRKRIGENISQVTHTSVAVPENTPGFRISAATQDATFIDQLEAFATGNFQGMKFGQNRGEGWCLSYNPDDTFYDLCISGEAHGCIDFCADGTYHFCDLNTASSCLYDKDATKETAAAAVE